jgi:histidinol-phosphate aminotransferase
LLDTPNNPTGKSLPNDFLARLSTDFPGVILVDEAYGEFASQTFLETFKGRELPRGLCILKTLSKAWGMAGLRFGYAACSGWIWNRLESVRDIYNVGLLSQEIASIVLQYREWMESRVLSIRYMRNQFIQAVNRIPGWQAYESASNFTLVRYGLNRDTIIEGLASAGIHVKAVELDRPGTWMRVTIGKEEEMGRFLDFAQNRL